MKNLKSKIKVVATLLMLTLVVTIKVAPVMQHNNTVSALSVGYDIDSNY
ncbi:hypothetical protein [Anaerocolumna aminovalerica]|nr:hypothetical protein [Anaerocolumna aminovalerica]MBU5330690.1 hypothetical protein [Anaerocolumna aminovalerica]